DRRRGDGDEVEVGARVVFRGGISRLIIGDDIEIVSLAGNELGQSDGMTGDERRIGGGEVEGEIGAVTDDGAGWLGGLPRDGNDPDVHGGGHTADNGRGQVGQGRGDPLDAEAVNVIGFNG